jgi:hypothetical protein
MKNMKIIAFLILGLTAVAEIAEYLNKITIWQLLAINVACIIMGVVLVIFLFYKIRKLRKTGNMYINFPDIKVIIPKAHIDNRFITANSDVFKKNIVPTNPFRTCVFRISMEINASIEQLGISAVRFRESRIIENVITKDVEAREAYVIDTTVLPNETINFKFDKDIDIKKLFIDELYIP